MIATDILSKLYYDPEGSASFGNIDRLYNVVKKLKPTISRNDIRQFLQQ